MLKYDAIYARQSVDRMDSISIESQIDFCKYEARGGEYRVFQDKGYSGKNTDRPNFQIMLEAIRRGEVKRVIVYKLDRISRSILDFATMMAEFRIMVLSLYPAQKSLILLPYGAGNVQYFVLCSHSLNGKQYSSV